MLDYWGSACAVTGLTLTPALRASHAKPWADCTTDAERLDVFNGFLLSANLDALFIVSSCNADFNVARLERYLALANESGAEPVAQRMPHYLQVQRAPQLAVLSDQDFAPQAVSEPEQATSAHATERLVF